MSLLEAYDPYVFMFWFWTINEFPYFGLNNDSWVCWKRMIHMFLCSGFERSMSFHILVWIMIHEFVGSVWSICFYVLVLNDQWVSIFWFKWSMSFLEAYDPYVFCSGFELSMGFHDLVWMIYEFTCFSFKLPMSFAVLVLDAPCNLSCSSFLEFSILVTQWIQSWYTTKCH